MKTLPHITTKQQAILKLLYRYRFLNRTQIQAFLHHKDKGLCSKWLKDLKEKQYIAWIYNADDFAEKTKPAIYYLSLNGVRFLRQLGEYPSGELHKRYTESSRKRLYIDRCLLLADCCLNMNTRSAADSGMTYTYSTEADYANPDNEYFFLNESEFIHPSLCYLKEKNAADGFTETTYLIEIFDAATPRYMVKKKLRGYVNFLDSDEWTDGTGEAEPPIVHVACPSVAELIYAKRYTRKLLEGIGQEDNKDICIRFATTDQVNEFGATGKIWEDL
jgi:hypothetical protein